MNKRSTALLVISAALLYMIGAGAPAAIIAGEPLLQVLTAPLTQASSSLVSALLMLAALTSLGYVLVSAGTSAHHSAEPLSRTTVLTGIALGCAVLGAALFSLLIARHGEIPAATSGMLLLVATCQVFVGLIAGSLLLTRQESRSYGWIPVVANTTLAGLMATLLFFPI